MSIKIQPLDGKAIDIDEKYLTKSKYIQEQKKPGTDIKVDIKSNILSKVIEYLKHFTDSKETEPEIPEPLPDGDFSKAIGNDFAAKFIEEQDFETVFEIINAGALLELDRLHDLACARIAHFMKGKSPEEVNKHFTIECQLTNEEAKELGLDVEEEG